MFVSRVEQDLDSRSDEAVPRRKRMRAGPATSPWAGTARGRFVRPSTFLGVALVLASGLLAWQESRVRTAPTAAPLGMGFVVPVHPRDRRGIYVRVRVRTDGCRNPVRVEALAGGSDEYWSRASVPTPDLARVAFAIDDTRVRNLRLRLARVSEADPTAIPPYSRAREFAPPGTLSHVTTEVLRAGGSYGVKVISARVRLWGLYQAPMIASFDADWISRRDGASCFLRLPALVGYGADCALAVPMKRLFITNLPLLVAPREQGPPVCDPGREAATSASTFVDAAGAHVDATASQPPPGGSDLLRWSCSAPRSMNSRVVGAVGELPVAPPPTVHDLHRSVGEARTCAANVVLAENGGASRQTLLLIVYGAIMGLGLTLVVEGIMARVDRRSR
jgi:hypothetical protein